MGGLFGGGGSRSSPPPQPAPQVVYMPMPTSDDTEVKAAEERQRKAGVFAKGRQSTLLTGGAGVTDTATTTRKTLLGE